jgi:hypothetical protein
LRVRPARPVFEDRGFVTEGYGLTPLSPSAADRRRNFVAARDHFAHVLGARSPELIAPPRAVDDDALGLALALHIAALVAVDAHLRGVPAPRDVVGLSAYMLRREWRPTTESARAWEVLRVRRRTY